MLEAEIPCNEGERIAHLRRYGILDTDAEESFDRITRIAQKTLDVPIALISFVDEARQWFKSRQGLDACETDRSASFCAHAILDDKVFIVNDTHDDERFFDNPLVTGPPYIRFYAGAPLITQEGYKLGTLCAISNKPHRLNQKEQSILHDLAYLVMDELALRKVRQKLQQELKMRDRFFSIIAHDLRNPFNALIGFSHPALVQNEPKEVLLDNLSHIHNSAENIYEMTNKLLAWAQLQLNPGSITPGPNTIGQIIDGEIKCLAANAEAKSIKLVVQHDDEKVICDPDSISFVIRNLVSNAIKFSASGGTVSVGVENNEDDVVISIIDQGQGIENEILEHIFNVEEKTTSEGTLGETGTGLGLPLCHEFVKNNLGRLTVKTQPGLGSCFSVTLGKAGND